MILFPLTAWVPDISLVPRAVTDDHYCLNGEGKLDFRKKNIVCYDFAQDIFPTCEDGYNMLKFNARVISPSGKVLRTHSITKKGFRYFAWKEKTFSIVCSLRVSWVGAHDGKYILQMTSTLISQGNHLGRAASHNVPK